MEQQHRPPVVLSIARRALSVLTGSVMAAVLVAGTGCSTLAPSKSLKSSRATPAAKYALEERPMVYLPPVKLATSEDAIVRILSDVTCTGTLIAEDQVLTAHHCVSERDGDGRPTGKDVQPSSVTIELGGDYLPWGDVEVRAIISPDCGYRSGAGDIAILVLKRKLIGISTMVPRLEGPPRAKTSDKHGDVVAPYGFGRCALSRDAIKRVKRMGGMVSTVGASDFVVDASICPGDSGGPAIIEETGEVIGVISSSMMDADDTTTAVSFFTRLDVWRQLFSAAQEISNGASPSELPPYRSCAK